MEQNNGRRQTATDMPLALLFAPVIYLALLITSTVLWSHLRSFKLLDFVPLSVLWAGMLGGVVSSLQGMFLHAKKDWNDNYLLWHIFSGVIGATFGIVAYLFVLVTVKAASGSSGAGVSAIYLLAAFTLGYGQKQFDSLMTQLFRLLFHPEKSPSDEGQKPSGHVGA